MSQKTKKLMILNLPYAIIGLFCSNIGEAWRLASGADISAKLASFFSCMGEAWSNPMPSFHPFDLILGLAIGACFRLVVYVRGKNAKKYRHNEEYGSARWGGPKDIEPFIDPVFEKRICKLFIIGYGKKEINPTIPMRSLVNWFLLLYSRNNNRVFYIWILVFP